MKNPKIKDVAFWGATDVGSVRKNNEDTLIFQKVWDDNHILCAAIDGMGGYEGGEVAAEIARSTIVNYFEQITDHIDCLAIIKQAVIEANNAIVAAKESMPKLSQMGCVATVGLFDLEYLTLYMAHVGDSRLYKYENGELTKLSHDHSIVGYREEIGDLTEEEAMHHPQRNLIDRSLGDCIHTVDDPNYLEAAIFPITATSDFLFCSDGLSDVITSAQIKGGLESYDDLKEAVAFLIRLTNSLGGKDNITVVITRLTLEHTDEASVPGDDTPAERKTVAGVAPQAGNKPLKHDAPVNDNDTKPADEVEDSGKEKKYSPVVAVAASIAAFLIGAGIGTVAAFFM